MRAPLKLLAGAVGSMAAVSVLALAGGVRAAGETETEALIVVNVAAIGHSGFHREIDRKEALEFANIHDADFELAYGPGGLGVPHSEARTASGISLALISELAGVNPERLSRVNVSLANAGAAEQTLSGEEVLTGYPHEANAGDSENPPHALIEVASAGAAELIRPKKTVGEYNGDHEVIGFPIVVTLEPDAQVLKLLGSDDITVQAATGGGLLFHAPEVEYEGTRLAPSELEYRWSFGDGTTSNEPTPQHRYPASGTPASYSIRLLLKDRSNVAEAVSVLHYSEVASVMNTGALTTGTTSTGTTSAGVSTTTSGATTTGTTVHPVSPLCSLKAASSKVQGPPPHQHGKARVSVIAECNQAVTVVIEGAVTVRGKEIAIALPLGSAHASLGVGSARTLGLELPPETVKALRNHAKESVSLALTATNAAHATAHVAAYILALTL